ncbi:conserved exported hypothetical protein [Nostocoides australiense Ben110]|uniref:Integral membrane protein n=1 Tax=Nostocoides australiense Ben110 TaxID=1193182 RepID=W6JZC5_9MICO|nr:DUF2516 family protein [Tetrasphaera australiensis]CCH74151.1 conserved exported hypothetical protein [Tetrasphaera australiensis Ben110]
MLHTVQSWVLLILGAGALGLEAFAVVDALRRRPDAFVAAGKRTKQFWTILLGVAAAIGFVTLFSPLNIFGLLAVVAGAVYLADVRPALDQAQGKGGQRMGPYGPW